MVFGDRRGSWGASPEEAGSIVKRYAQAGGNFIDTANHYAGGESERIVGELIRPDRDRWVLATKYTLSGPQRSQRRRLAPQERASRRGRQPQPARDRLHRPLLGPRLDTFTPVEEVMNLYPDLPDEIRRVVEGPHHGWLRP
jgi:aryl-alcohol dehydrogenase-like predicted oxidoreductase